MSVAYSNERIDQEIRKQFKDLPWMGERKTGGNAPDRPSAIFILRQLAGKRGYGAGDDFITPEIVKKICLRLKKFYKAQGISASNIKSFTKKCYSAGRSRHRKQKKGSRSKSPKRAKSSSSSGCSSGKIRNPKTNRCVSSSGAIGKAILAGKSPPRRGGKSRASGAPCSADKIRNPKTGRCVSRSGAIGKAILANKSPPRRKR